MSHEITTRERSQIRPILPINIEEAFRLAKAFAMAEMLPKSYMTGSLEKAQSMAFTAMQLGAEVGMSPMQSIQSIAVVNGMPSIWGDAQKALVISSGVCEYIKETYAGAGEPYSDAYKAICTVKRKGQDEVTEEFTVADAKKAGLWGKAGTWSQYPKRMLKYRARSFALRDVFPDILKGLTHSTEELEGMEDVTPQKTPPNKKERSQATGVNDILDKQNAEQAMPVTQKPIEKEGQSAPEENAITENPAQKRCDIIMADISAIQNPDELRKYVKDNETHIIVMPGDMSDAIFTAIGTQKEILGIAAAEDLFAG